jgi:uncharacterized protein
VSSMSGVTETSLSTDQAPPGPRGPARADERALAPDLARGVMLLMIVLANTPFYLYGQRTGLASTHPEEGTVLDRISQLLIITFVDQRVYPMFAFLFGYGMVQLFSRQVAAGTPVQAARRLLRKRNLWLLVFGFLHAALLWYGDVLGAYGLAGLVMVALFFKRKDQTLLTWAISLTGALLTSTVMVLMVAPMVAAFADQVPMDAGSTKFFGSPTMLSGIESYPESILWRLAFWPLLVVAQGLLFQVIPVMILLAFWAGRRRILEEPGRHLPLLRRIAVIGLAVGWGFGLVHALEHVGVFSLPDQLFWVFPATQATSGLFGGLGYVALFGLLGHRIAQRGETPGLITVAVTAVGKRSLSCYLAQSVICAPALAAWGLGLGAVFGSAAVALFAVGVWLLTVVIAYASERAGVRGPAEVLLRRLVYPRSGTRSASTG